MGSPVNGCAVVFHRENDGTSGPKIPAKYKILCLVIHAPLHLLVHPASTRMIIVSEYYRHSLSLTPTPGRPRGRRRRVSLSPNRGGEGALACQDSYEAVHNRSVEEGEGPAGGMFEALLQTGIQGKEDPRILWELYLPIARHSADLFLLLGLGGVVGFISGLFGIGGGFLMTPLLIMVGIPPTVAAASDSNQIIAAATSGTYAHYRMGNVDLKMGAFLLFGNWAGGTLGVEIIKVLRGLGEADFLIRITYVLMLGAVGCTMFVEALKSLRKKPIDGEGREDSEAMPLYIRLGQFLPWQTRFDKSQVTISFLLPLGLGCLVGIIAAVMGIGGGFIMVPLMFYLLRMPMHLVVGTNLFQEAFLCINVTMMQAVANHVVDIVLALALLIGSSLGAQFGARFSVKLHADQLRFLLAVIVLLVMVKMLLGLLLPPHFMLDMKGGG